MYVYLVKERHNTLKSDEKLNHLPFMDDLKLFAKDDENEINGLLSTVQISSNDKRMEFGL